MKKNYSVGLIETFPDQWDQMESWVIRICQLNALVIPINYPKCR